MSTLIADKLDFLEVTRTGLSKLQQLLVQFEVNCLPLLGVSLNSPTVTVTSTGKVTEWKEVGGNVRNFFYF